MFSKFKSLLRSERGFFAVVLVLLAVVAYGLGLEAGQLSERAAANASGQPAIVFTAAPNAVIPADATPVVASRGGTKYHRLDCSSANSIKDSNKIYFESIELARASGYLPAGNCWGLE